jgi:hypothetical protein
MKLTALAVLLLGALPVAQAGFVTVEKEAGVWWFKSPEGKPFVSLGINHVEPVYWQTPLNAAFVAETYGSEIFAADGTLREGTPAATKWGQRVAKNLDAWGMNTLGFHNPLSKGLQSGGAGCYVIELDLHVPWGWNMPRSQLARAFKRDPLDVFGDEFAAAVEANALAVVKLYANDPRVLGYAYTDGPPWTVDDDAGDAAFQKLSAAGKKLHPWVLALMSLPATAKGKQAWLALMKERYPAPDKAGATYALTITGWDALAANTAWTKLGDAARAVEDSQAFLLKIMQQWYAVRKAGLRKYDANHLILGDKLNMNRDSRHPAELTQSLHVMKPHVDVINIQYYGFFDKQREALALLHRESQLPILNGDTTFTPYWKDPGADTADYYKQLGQDYAGEITKLFALPYFIGWHHCGYMRGLRPPYAAALKRGDKPAADVFVKGRHTLREGFISVTEEPIEPLLTPLIAAWKKCETVHRAAGAADGIK